MQSIPSLKSNLKISVTLLTTCVIAIVASSAAHADSRGKSLADRLSRIEAALSALSEKVDNRIDELAANTIPCTPSRFRDNLCGPFNQPFDLTVTVCGTVGAEAAANADFQFNNSNEFHLGVGNAEVVDVGLVRNVEFPGIPGIGLAGAAVGAPGVVIFGAPFPNIGVGAAASGGLTLDGCYKVPVQVEIKREAALELLEQIESSATELRDELVNTITERNFTAGRVTDVIAAMDTYQSESRSSDADSGVDDSFNLLERGRSLGNLVEALPVGERVQKLLDDPSRLLASLADPDATGRPRAGDFCESIKEPGMERIAAAVGKSCDTLETLPDFEQIQSVLSGELIGDLFDALDSLTIGGDAAKVGGNTKARFCSSRVGSLPRFNDFCGRS